MADEDNQNESKGRGKERKSSGKMMIIIAAVLVLVIGGGAGAFFMMQSAEKEESEENAVKKALFLDLEPFVVSLVGERKSHYMQLELSLMTRHESVLVTIEENMPLIRNELIRFMSGMTYQDTLMAETPDVIRKQSLEKIQNLLADQQGELVEDVLVTNLVIQ